MFANQVVLNCLGHLEGEIVSLPFNPFCPVINQLAASYTFTSNILLILRANNSGSEALTGFLGGMHGNWEFSLTQCGSRYHHFKRECAFASACVCFKTASSKWKGTTHTSMCNILGAFMGSCMLTSCSYYQAIIVSRCYRWGYKCPAQMILFNKLAMKILTLRGLLLLVLVDQ